MVQKNNESGDSSSSRSNRRSFLKRLAFVTPVGFQSRHDQSNTATLVSTLANVQQEEDTWQQFGHDAGTTFANPVATGPSGPVVVKWRYTPPTGSMWLPAVVDDTLYAGDFNIQEPGTGTVTALNLNDGSVRWRTDVADAATGIAVDDDTVYAESLDTNVYALDAATGETRWQFAAPADRLGELRVANNTVYATSFDTTLYAIDAATGAEQWRFTAIAAGGPSIPAVADDFVYVTTPGAQTAAENRVYALDAATGNVRWRFDDAAHTTHPVVAAGTVYIAEGQGEGPGDGVVYALDAKTGDEQWRFEQPTPRTLHPVVVGDTAVIASPDGTVYAFSTEDGSLRWLFVESSPVFPLLSASSTTVYVPNGTEIDAMDLATGKLRWRFSEATAPVLPPAVVGETAYVVDNTGTMYAVTSAGQQARAKSTEPKLVVDCDCDIAETPLWHPMAEQVYWNDIPNGKLFRYDPSTDHDEVVYETDFIGAFTIQQDGSLLVFENEGRVVSLQNDTAETVIEIPGEADRFFNDVIADSMGRVFAGTYAGLDRAAEPIGRLYRIDPDGSVTQVLDDLRLSNGMGFSPDQNHFYLTESWAFTIHRFAYDEQTGTIADRETFVQHTQEEAFEQGFGGPDGLTVDSEGYVWSARFRGPTEAGGPAGSLFRHAPDGTRVRRVDMPADNVTSLTFGGPNYRDVFVTTARGPTDAGKEAGGALYSVQLGVTGRPEFLSRVLL